jgi:hypothetical protein
MSLPLMNEMHNLTHRGATLVCPSARVIFELLDGNRQNLVPLILCYSCSRIISVFIDNYIRQHKQNAQYCLFVCFPDVTTHCVCIFHSPVAGFSLFGFEVS